jgi:hypothetical protein
MDMMPNNFYDLALLKKLVGRIGPHYQFLGTCQLQ